MGERTNAEEHGANDLVVVGIGASAGGLEAMFELFDELPSDAGVSYLVVTHQQPGRTSLLPELLQRHTAMPVTEAEDGGRIRADHVYVSPAGAYLAMDGSTLRTVPVDHDVPRFPIDAFFRSLATAKGHLAVGVVLSGSGTDGTVGMQAIKAAEGVTLAQSAESAAYAAMPTSAEMAGVVDHVASPRDMAPVLVRCARGILDIGEAGHGMLEATMPRIVGLLRERRGHDFSQYKPSTLRRRVLRRLDVHGISTPADYVRLLETDHAEVELLFRELLIGVTSFFRDPEAFAALADALRSELERKPEGEPIRVWVAGCSTGEEAYSIAILLQEVMDQIGRHFPVQVFATDIDPRAIDAARSGLFPYGIAADVSPARLERYFVEAGERFRIRKDLRETLVFAVQNLIQDPPFTRLDLLVCRNVLIYFGAALQRQLLPVFHYAIRPGGLLLLGTSEAIGALADSFDPVDRKWKLFRRQAGSSAFLRGRGRGPIFRAQEKHPQLAGPPSRRLSPEQLAGAALLELLGPTVLVDSQGDIVHLHGRTGRYLEPTPGGPRMNVIAMAREGLELDLNSVLREASVSDAPVARAAVRFHPNGGAAYVGLRAKRIVQPEALRGLIAISFEDQPAPVEPTSLEEGERSPREAALEQELASSWETLESTIEQLETMNEELESTNEELESTNEELQSTNEELETSREEMQSLNEELHTVNQELQGKIDELSATNDDMRNLLDSTRIATIFLDRELRIMRFTPEATRVVSLIGGDVGRPLADLVAKMEYPELVEDAQATLRELTPRGREVRGTDGAWYLAHMGPYQTSDNIVDGLVLTFVDISAVEEAQGEERKARALAEAIVGAVREPFVVVDRERRIVQSNAAFSEMFSGGDSMDGQVLDDVKGPGGQLAALLEARSDLLEPGAHSFEHEFPGVGVRRVNVSVRAIDGEATPTHIVLAFDDVGGSQT
jgi:two-component system CheB/CheR fusion protein